MNELSIKGRTELLPYREVNERKVFAYADIAEGLQVEPSIVRRQYARNAEAWNPDETGVSQIDAPSGTQEIRWFTARGAMRFCRYVKSGRSDALFNHLLDLWEAERSGVAIKRDPISEIDRFAAMMSQVVPAINDRLILVENAQKALDPHKLVSDSATAVIAHQKVMGELRGQLKTLVNLVVSSAKKRPPEDLIAKAWNHHAKVYPLIHSQVGVGALSDYATVEQANHGIELARHMLAHLGAKIPSQLRLVG
jgi:hypothetical protein